MAIFWILLFCFLGSFALGWRSKSWLESWLIRRNGTADDLDNVESWVQRWREHP